jgi:hypothetical protein
MVEDQVLRQRLPNVSLGLRQVPQKYLVEIRLLATIVPVLDSVLKDQPFRARNAVPLPRSSGVCRLPRTTDQGEHRLNRKRAVTAQAAVSWSVRQQRRTPLRRLRRGHKSNVHRFASACDEPLFAAEHASCQNAAAELSPTNLNRLPFFFSGSSDSVALKPSDFESSSSPAGPKNDPCC